MTAQAISVLLVGDGDTARLAALLTCLTGAGFTANPATDLLAARQHDAVLLCASGAAGLAALAQRPDLPQAAFDSAVVVLAGAADDAAEAALLRAGVEAIVLESEAPALAPALSRTLRHAVLRKQVERLSHSAFATDLATGLPHQAQLLEHMTQLLALREREPSPMVLLVLRIEGYAAAAARLGAESANVLRRKVAVRLRSGLRASDVVAAIGPDAFGVLLPHLEALGDGERVAAKLARTLEQPLLVAGQPCAVTAAVGLALYPTHGKDADSLFKRASAQAGWVTTMGREGYGGASDRTPGGAAANDDA